MPTESPWQDLSIGDHVVFIVDDCAFKHGAFPTIFELFVLNGSQFSFVRPKFSSKIIDFGDVTWGVC